MGSSARRRRIGLGLLQLLIGVAGVAGGVGLISDPTGGNTGMSLEALMHTPFSDYLIPGLVLFAINGVGQLSSGVLSLASRRRYPEAAMLLGTFLVAWIVSQVWWLGLVHWLQPLFFFLGVVEVTLGLRAKR
ncbi:MAG: hypothetical protein GY953_15790 [bacterium]|nr:hypothetical protein [bacterium]